LAACFDAKQAGSEAVRVNIGGLVVLLKGVMGRDGDGDGALENRRRGDGVDGLFEADRGGENAVRMRSNIDDRRVVDSTFG